MPLPPVLEKLLVCPACKGQLTHDERAERLTCAACRLAYPIRDGIPIMLRDEAAPLAP